MRITDLLKKEGIYLNAKVNSKKEAIDTLVDLMDNNGNLNNKDESSDIYQGEYLKQYGWAKLINE